MAYTRRTKIIATLGPASAEASMLRTLINDNVDVFRINFSHGDSDTHQQIFANIRETARQAGKEVAIMVDLQGPKIRIAKFRESTIHLLEGDDFYLDANLGEKDGDHQQVGITYKQLPADVKANDILLLDDGLIELVVVSVEQQRIHTRVISGGTLSNNKGINRKGGGLSARALTEKDKQDIKTAVQLSADYIAVSFPRSAEDINEARHLITEAGGICCVIAKIERSEAVEHIDEIIKASDGVMVARGDLAVEIGNAEVPAVQKHIINRARALNRAVITATQMMESMINNPVPTRAEVSDVANAVIDGTDAVMLSAETATGHYPHKVVLEMANVCLTTEKHPIAQALNQNIECTFSRVDEAIAMAAMYTANHLNIKAIITLTETGSTPLWMSRIRSTIPIYALTRHIHTLRKMKLFRGVYPHSFDPLQFDRHEINRQATNVLQALNLVQEGDLVIITKGNFMGTIGGTNSMKILRVGEM